MWQYIPLKGIKSIIYNYLAKVNVSVVWNINVNNLFIQQLEDGGRSRYLTSEHENSITWQWKPVRLLVCVWCPYHEVSHSTQQHNSTKYQLLSAAPGPRHQQKKQHTHNRMVVDGSVQFCRWVSQPGPPNCTLYLSNYTCIGKEAINCETLMKPRISKVLM